MLDREDNWVTISYWLRTFAGMLLMCAATAHAQQVTVSKDTQLRAEPRFDSAPVAQVTQGVIGTTSQKQGPWLLVNVEGNSGWVLTTDIVYGEIEKPEKFVSLFSRPQQAPPIYTVETAHRPHNLPQLTEPINEEQLELLDRYAVSKEVASQFAKERGLVPLTLPY